MERVQRLLWHLVAPLDEAQDAGVEERTAPVVSLGEGAVEEEVGGILRSVRSFVGELVSDLVPGEEEVRMRREHRALRERMQKKQHDEQYGTRASPSAVDLGVRNPPRAENLIGRSGNCAVVQRFMRQQPMQIPAMPICPVHHGSYAESCF